MMLQMLLLCCDDACVIQDSTAGCYTTSTLPWHCAHVSCYQRWHAYCKRLKFIWEWFDNKRSCIMCATCVLCNSVYVPWWVGYARQLYTKILSASAMLSSSVLASLLQGSNCCVYASSVMRSNCSDKSLTWCCNTRVYSVTLSPLSLTLHLHTPVLITLCICTCMYRQPAPSSSHLCYEAFDCSLLAAKAAARVCLWVYTTLTWCVMWLYVHTAACTYVL